MGVETHIGLDIDASVYLLTRAGKVRSDDDMVLFGKRGSAEIGTTLTTSDRDGASFTTFKLPDGIEKAAMTIVDDDTVGTGRGFSHAGVLEITAEGLQGTHTYKIDAAATGLVAVILAEVYVRNGEVKVRAVGQGFAGGLKPCPGTSALRSPTTSLLRQLRHPQLRQRRPPRQFPPGPRSISAWCRSKRCGRASCRWSRSPTTRCPPSGSRQ